MHFKENKMEINDMCPICDHEFFNSELDKFRTENEKLCNENENLKILVHSMELQIEARDNARIDTLYRKATNIRDEEGKPRSKSEERRITIQKGDE